MGMQRWTIVTAVALATLAGGARAASAQVDRRIGVVVSVRVNVNADEARALADQLASGLSAELPVDVVSGAETERRLPQGGLPDECVADAPCRVDLGRRLDADELLFLVIVRMGEQVQIDPTWADIASGRVTARSRITLSKGDDPVAVFRKAAPALLPHIARQQREPETKVIVVPGAGAARADDGHHMTRGSWIAAGVGAAALIGGGVFALSARNKYDALDRDNCRDTAEPPCSQSRIDSLRHRALAADILLGGAVAAGVTTLVLYYRSGGEQRPAPTAAPPPVTVGLAGGGLSLSIGGRF